MKIRCA